MFLFDPFDCSQVAEPLLHRINDRSVDLQTVELDYSTAMDRILEDLLYFRTLLTQPLQEAKVDECWKEAERVLLPHDVEWVQPRKRKPKKQSDEDLDPEPGAPLDDPKRYFEAKFYVPFITQIISQYEFRFGTNPRALSRVSLLLPDRVHEVDPNGLMFRQAYEFYRTDLGENLKIFRCNCSDGKSTGLRNG